jgi:hypothetical protein
MTVILQDPVGARDPSARHAFPDSKAEAPIAQRTLAEELLAGYRAGNLGETSFELESHGGYARAVTGTVAYLDEGAHTFMVRTRDGELLRVPVRDIMSTHGMAVGESDQPQPSHDVEGLGTQY